MPSLDGAAEAYGHVSLDDERIVVVHLLLFGLRMEPPTVDDARRWATHYQLADRANQVVAIARPGIDPDRAMSKVPGLQLVDRDFVLRYDAAGSRAPHDLWRELWPAVSGELARVEVRDR
jgi:hypothetical protein